MTFAGSALQDLTARFSSQYELHWTRKGGIMRGVKPRRSFVIIHEP